jgi:hypothetical protein
MKINIQTDNFSALEPSRVGNVYPMRGGKAAKLGYLMVLIAITEPKQSWQGSNGLMLCIDKDGDPQGVTSYGMTHIDELAPIAFVDGLDDITLMMRSL